MSELAKAVIAGSAKIAHDADVVGDVYVGEEASVWYHAVVRGLAHKEQEDGYSITIGNRTNIQDGCVLHVDPGEPMVLGEGVTVGHMALLHSCEVGDNTIIGMGSIVLNGAKIGKNCLIGAGSLVTGGTVIPDGMMAFGRPAKPVKALLEEAVTHNQWNADLYVEEAKEFYK